MGLLFIWFLLPILAFMLFAAIFLPLHFTFFSLVNILTIPGQVWKIATNKRLRQNHALEHATINVVEEKYGPTRLAGYAVDDGFYVKGLADPAIINEAAHIGLARLKQGEDWLAIHNRCGTSMLAANFLSSLVFLVSLFVLRILNIFTVILALALANFAGPLLGQLVQRYLTTTADVEDVSIVGINYRQSASGWFGARAVVPTDLFIRTDTLYRGHSL